MDIHKEADNILASLQQNQPQLRFEFHSAGCTVILCNAAGEHHYQMAPHQLLALKRLFTFGGNNYLYELMEARTIAYFIEEQPNA